MPSVNTWRTAEGRQKGAALLELTVVVPIITVLGLGVFEFSNYFYDYQLIQNGVRDAARYGASLPYDSTNTTANNTAIKNLAVTGQPSGGTNRLTWWTASNITVTWSTVTNSALS